MDCNNCILPTYYDNYFDNVAYPKKYNLVYDVKHCLIDKGFDIICNSQILIFNDDIKQYYLSQQMK